MPPQRSRSTRREHYLREAKSLLRSGPYATLTACVLRWGTPDNGRLWPAQATIARDLGLHVRTVRRHLAAVEAAGLLTVERSAPVRGANGRWCRRRTNRYRPNPQVAPRGPFRPLNPFGGRNQPSQPPLRREDMPQEDPEVTMARFGIVLPDWLVN